MITLARSADTHAWTRDFGRNPASPDEDDTAPVVSPKQREDLGDHTAGVRLSLSAVSRLTLESASRIVTSRKRR